MTMHATFKDVSAVAKSVEEVCLLNELRTDSETICPQHSNPSTSNPDATRIPERFLNNNVATSCGRENLAGTGTITDVFALVVREDSSDEMSHLSSVVDVTMLDCISFGTHRPLRD
ncbi:hypothetical protein BCR33DRAFT_739961 [Rhizoclosmatium globosum]|uniref:Uncharacterized protein n=1 Tax=Rhizoclosmatium globosum TaxID=329046 RepID=A0A1Y2C205_9FUNG|nr:hypothetical protein BCR33DRAFT_739961 [Rhizoclosmatium globosum]|eukprot:ORY40986.1 hypothetical protein BCR33DRAFT_739961 [Rhizoclosmatium globosum]